MYRRVAAGFSLRVRFERCAMTVQTQAEACGYG